MTAIPTVQPFEIHYRFVFSGGRKQEFLVQLHPVTFQILNVPKSPAPEWANLTYHQCPNCPLNSNEAPLCPAAAQLPDFVSFAESVDSFEEADIEITMNQRAYRKKTAVQYGLSSLMGVYMTASGCPILNSLRPMVKTHLPFAKSEEVTYRTVSMYLLAQFFRMKEGKPPDWELKGLLDMNKEIETVNQSFWKRISSANLQIKDGGVNAITHLNTIAKLAAYQIEGPELENLKKLFSSYLGG